jgi:hypothetical protein
MVQAWQMRIRGILGPRLAPLPQAHTAFAPAQFGGVPYYYVPPSVANALGYGQPPPPPPSYMLPSSFGAPPTATVPAPPDTSFQQQALINAQHEMSMHNQGGWIADSGASSHFTANNGTLHTSTPSSSFPPVIVGNGNSIPITHVGHTSLPISSSRPLYLDIVLVAPQSIHDLLYVRRFTTDNSLSMEFDPFGVTIKDLQTRAALLRCDSQGDLYPIYPPSTPSYALPATTPSKDLWHRRLGHPGVSSSFNKNFPCNNLDNLSQACQLGKHVRLPFKPSTTHSSAAFELLHCDLWTAPLSSNSDMKYYLLITDDFTHFMWTFPLRFKSDVHHTITNFHSFIRTHFHRVIATIQCDNGKEFDNLLNRNFLTPHGTKLRFSCPYTSSQNGKAEPAIHNK